MAVKGKHIIDHGLSDMYKYYKSHSKNPVDLKTYRKVVEEFNSGVASLILEKAFEFRMPFRLGYISIKKCKVRLILDPDGNLKKNYLKIDWNATKTLWKNNPKAKEQKKLVYHLNRHTDGYYFKWYWNKAATNVRNISVYKIIPTRKNSRAISKLLSTNEELDYYE